MTGSERTATFYFGLGSRYSYLASTQIAALEARTGAKIEWRPVLSSMITSSHGQAPFQWDEKAGDWWGARVSGQYRDSYRRADVARWAALYDIPYQEPKPPIMEAKRHALYCVAAAIAGKGQDYAARMFNVIYAEGVAVDEHHCRDTARAVGLKSEDLEARIETGEAEAVHSNWLAQAQGLGVFGVPSFVCNGSMFWGNDRLVLLEAELSR